MSIDKNQVIKLAEGYRLTKKPNKKEIFRIIETLINDTHINKSKVAKIYAYFMPKFPKKPKNDFDWVRLALGENKKYINDFKSKITARLHVINGDLIATDGHRIHVLKNCGYNDGSYDPMMNQIEDDESEKVYDAIKQLLNVEYKNEIVLYLNQLDLINFDDKFV